jgi:hypothetical protein
VCEMPTAWHGVHNITEDEPAEVNERRSLPASFPTRSLNFLSLDSRPNNATIDALKEEVARLRRRLGEEVEVPRVSQGAPGSVHIESSGLPEVSPLRIISSTTSQPRESTNVLQQPPTTLALATDVLRSNVLPPEPEPFDVGAASSPGRMDDGDHFSPAHSIGRIHGGGDGCATAVARRCAMECSRPSGSHQRRYLPWPHLGLLRRVRTRLLLHAARAHTVWHRRHKSSRKTW